MRGDGGDTLLEVGREVARVQERHRHQESWTSERYKLPPREAERGIVSTGFACVAGVTLDDDRRMPHVLKRHERARSGLHDRLRVFLRPRGA